LKILKAKSPSQSKHPPPKTSSIFKRSQTSNQDTSRHGNKLNHRYTKYKTEDDFRSHLKHPIIPLKIDFNQRKITNVKWRKTNITVCNVHHASATLQKTKINPLSVQVTVNSGQSSKKDRTRKNIIYHLMSIVID